MSWLGMLAGGGLAVGILTESLFFMALINPISKVCVLTALTNDTESRELRMVALRSTAVALIILLAFALGGSFVLIEVFHVEEYSLRIAGGVVLFLIGLQALTKGKFFELTPGQTLSEVSIVPLASPMIAGPATIAAAISQTATAGFGVAAPAIIIALAVNFVVMLASLRIGRLLTHFNLMGALIRITGLLVSAIAVEMVLSGLGVWLRAVGVSGG